MSSVMPIDRVSNPNCARSSSYSSLLHGIARRARLRYRHEAAQADAFEICHRRGKRSGRRRRHTGLRRLARGIDLHEEVERRQARRSLSESRRAIFSLATVCTQSKRSAARASCCSEAGRSGAIPGCFCLKGRPFSAKPPAHSSHRRRAARRPRPPRSAPQHAFWKLPTMSPWTDRDRQRARRARCAPSQLAGCLQLQP